jgi:hypothetical protein
LRGRSQEYLGGRDGAPFVVGSCHDAIVLPYAAYLRVYQPLDAFAEPERSAWSAYAASEERPRRAGALDVEHDLAMRRLIAVPPIVVPPRESPDAYVRRVDGTTYVCPWETRLRSWLALDRLRREMSDGLADLFVPRRVAEQAAEAFDWWRRRSEALTPHILSSTWQVPIVWFVPFVAKERWLVLEQGEGGSGGPTTAAPTRTLIYVTAMAQARRRLARALNVIKRHVDAGLDVGEVESVGRWLEEFHPHSLVELDYGGLVHVMDDAALRSDESVAEVAAAVTGMEAGEAELAVAMYQRVVARWRSVRALESAN